MFVPAHAGVQRTGRADRLVSVATISEAQLQDHADIINILRDVAFGKCRYPTKYFRKL